MELSVMVGVIATTALYGLGFAAQIGHREVPGLDLNLPPRYLHRHEELLSLFPYSDYRPKSNLWEAGDYLSKTQEPPFIDPYEGPQGFPKEISYEGSGNQHHFVQSSYRPRKMHYEHLRKPSAANAPAYPFQQLFEFLLNNLLQSPNTYPSQELKPLGKQELFSGDSSRKLPESSSEQLVLAFLSIGTSNKTQQMLENVSGKPSPSKRFQRSQPKLPYRKPLFRSFSLVSPDDHASTEFSSEDPYHSHIRGADKNYAPEVLHQQFIEPDESITISPGSQFVSSIFPVEKLSNKSLDDSERSISKAEASSMPPTVLPLDRSGTKHSVPIIRNFAPPKSPDIDYFDEREPLPKVQGEPKTSFLMDPPEPLGHS